jgi:hypothetical protein
LGISSQATISSNRSPAGQARSRFSLTGRSIRIDPRVDAARKDLADIRLADRIFAPHYAAPMPRTLDRDAVLRSGAPAEAEPMATLAAGETFEVLELSGDHAWGVAPAHGLVGYIDAATLAQGESAA